MKWGGRIYAMFILIVSGLAGAMGAVEGMLR